METASPLSSTRSKETIAASWPSRRGVAGFERSFPICRASPGSRGRPTGRKSGDRLLFCEGWEGGGASYSFFLRKSGGGDPVRLGEGFASDISPDGRWIISYLPHPPVRLTLVPAGIGESKTIELAGFDAVAGANWFPDAKRILLWASETGHAPRGYVLDLAGGPPRPVTPPEVFPRWVSHAVSPDGRSIAATDPQGNSFVYSVEGSEPRPIPGVLPGEEPVRWTADGRAVYVR